MTKKEKILKEFFLLAKYEELGYPYKPVITETHTTGIFWFRKTVTRYKYIKSIKNVLNSPYIYAMYVDIVINNN